MVPGALLIHRDGDGNDADVLVGDVLGRDLRHTDCLDDDNLTQ